MDRARNDQERCAYRSPSGRRCRNKVTEGWNMCHSHCDFGSAYAQAAEIVSNRDRLDTAEGVHSMLARVTRALAARKIHPRDANSLIYAGQTLLQSLTRLREERQKIFLSNEEEAWRMKALADSYHDELHCEESSEQENEEEIEEEQKAESAGTKKG